MAANAVVAEPALRGPQAPEPATDILIALLEDPDLAGDAAANPSLPVEVMEWMIAAHL
ncbi:hypothetical protein GCM10010492_59340 [Saccharothrix mutabilis subsp. mutabilis]|uniref:Uncharacterized protein n=1 Tax=Saccharothrix mutabilis subsp. mutabilis TaxID=66855 RepID=A0ABN0UHY0_9PSEU